MYKKILLIILFFSFFANSSLVLGQNFSDPKVYFKSPASTLAPGSEFIVDVLLDTGEPFNAFDLEVSYPKDKLEFLNFDNSESIVNIWQPKPAILPNGNLGIAGGIIKAWNGKGGLLIKLSFKVLSQGEAKISFAKNNLYKADGKGSEVKALTSSLSLSFKEGAKVVSVPSTPFEPTKEDVAIQKELENFKKDVFWDKMLTPVLLFASVLFVILSFAVYNKRKRKL